MMRWMMYAMLFGCSRPEPEPYQVVQIIGVSGAACCRVENEWGGRARFERLNCGSFQVHRASNFILTGQPCQP